MSIDYDSITEEQAKSALEEYRGVIELYDFVLNDDPNATDQDKSDASMEKAEILNIMRLIDQRHDQLLRSQPSTNDQSNLDPLQSKLDEISDKIDRLPNALSPSPAPTSPLPETPETPAIQALAEMVNNLAELVAEREQSSPSRIHNLLELLLLKQLGAGRVTAERDSEIHEDFFGKVQDLIRKVRNPEAGQRPGAHQSTDSDQNPETGLNPERGEKDVAEEVSSTSDEAPKVDAPEEDSSIKRIKKFIKLVSNVNEKDNTEYSDETRFEVEKNLLYDYQDKIYNMLQEVRFPYDIKTVREFYYEIDTFKNELNKDENTPEKLKAHANELAEFAGCIEDLMNITRSYIEKRSKEINSEDGLRPVILKRNGKIKNLLMLMLFLLEGKYGSGSQTINHRVQDLDRRISEFGKEDYNLKS